MRDALAHDAASYASQPVLCSSNGPAKGSEIALAPSPQNWT